MTARGWFALSVLVYLLLLGWAWAVLPEGPVPMHFGTGGEPDRWGSRTDALVSFAAIGLGTATLLSGAGRLVGSGGVDWRWVNLPHKDYWSTDERRPRARRMLAEDLAWLSTMTMALLCAAVAATVEAARSGGGLSPWFWGALGLYLVLVLGWTVRMYTHRYRPPVED